MFLHTCLLYAALDLGAAANVIACRQLAVDVQGSCSIQQRTLCPCIIGRVNAVQSAQVLQPNIHQQLRHNSCHSLLPHLHPDAGDWSLRPDEWLVSKP